MFHKGYQRIDWPHEVPNLQLWAVARPWWRPWEVGQGLHLLPTCTEGTCSCSTPPMVMAKEATGLCALIWTLHAGPFIEHILLIAVDAHSKWPDMVSMTSATSNHTVTVLRHMFVAQPSLTSSLGQWSTVYFIWVCSFLWSVWHQTCQNFPIPPIVKSWIGWTIHSHSKLPWRIWQGWYDTFPTSCYLALMSHHTTQHAQNKLHFTL